MRQFFVFLCLLALFSLNSIQGVEHATSDPILLYQEAIRASSAQEQSRLFNEALSSFLNHKPDSPSAIWHYDVASCFLALHEPGPAIYHYLEAQRLDSKIGEVSRRLAQARVDAGLSAQITDLRPFWVMPFFSKIAIEIAFLVSCLTAFFIASLGLFLNNRPLLVVAKALSILSVMVALLVIARFFEPLVAVVVSPEKLMKAPSEIALSRTLLPGEQVTVLDTRDKMVQVETSDGVIGWLLEKNCWVLSVSSG